MANQKDRSGGGGSPAPLPKPLFKVNEKVLCYEPDIKKAQVLYDSKVLTDLQQILVKRSFI